MIDPINSGLRDWVQTLSYAGAVIGIVVAIAKYVSEQKQNRRQQELQLDQRKSELRWKQVEAAKKMIDEMLLDPSAKAAMTMLDWNDLEYEIKPNMKVRIQEKDYLKALRTTDQYFTDVEVYIRSSFDNLFYYMAMMEHYIRSELVLLEDVTFPLDYYLKIMDRNQPVFTTFLAYYHQDRTFEFMERFRLLRSTG